MSDQEYFNFSDSSLELFDTFKPKPKSKTKVNFKKKSNHNDIFDTIDLTNELDLKFKKFKPQRSKKEKSSNIFNSNLSLCSISSNSNDSFKSASSSPSKSYYEKNSNQDVDSFDKSTIKVVHNHYLENNNSNPIKKNSKLKNNDTNIVLNNVVYETSEFQDNFSTPKSNRIQPSYLSESAKLLDRIYGKEWRCVDGVIKNVDKKDLNDEHCQQYNEQCDDNILDTDYNEIINLSCETPIKNRKYLQKQDVQNEVHNTSIIFENINLSDDLNDNQSNNDPLRANLKKSNTFKNDCNIGEKKDPYLNQPSKELSNKLIPELKLSFLSSLSSFTGSIKCDPSAEKYKLKFKKNKDDLVSVLFKLFNEEVFDNKLPANMNFKWNARLRSTAGACFNKRSVKIIQNLECERTSRIELSSKIIDTAERLRDTLIHELCHAACWIFNGISEGHGPSWKSWANKAMCKFPELPVIKRCHSYEVQTKFTYKCIKCGYSFGRHSKSLNLEKKRCGYCYGEFQLIVNKAKNPINSTNNNLPVVYTDPLKELYNLKDEEPNSKLPKKPSKFALFVKENYSRVKRENPLSKHGEIMKLLGSQYTTTKQLTPDEVFNKLLDI